MWVIIISFEGLFLDKGRFVFTKMLGIAIYLRVRLNRSSYF